MTDPSNVPASRIPDLGALRDLNSPMMQKNKQHLLTRNGLYCPCGELVRGEGVMLFASTIQMVETDQGLKPAFALGTVTYHSRACPALVRSLQLEDPKPLCIREIPPVEWIDEGILDGARTVGRVADGGDSHPDNGDRSE